MDAARTGEFAHIGKSVVIKGELSGSEDLTVDGTVEGTIQLQSNSLVIGPNGQVRAAIHAKNVAVQGKVEGNIRASERTELRKSAVVVGDIFTQRISVEEGAYLRGKVDVQKEAPKATPAAVTKPETSAEPKISVSGPSSTAVPGVASATVAGTKS